MPGRFPSVKKRNAFMGCISWLETSAKDFPSLLPTEFCYFRGSKDECRQVEQRSYTTVCSGKWLQEHNE